MSNSKSRGKASKSLKRETPPTDRRRKGDLKEGPRGITQPYHPQAAYSPGSSVYYPQHSMYAQYPPAAPGQLMAPPGQFMSPHFAMGRPADPNGLQNMPNVGYMQMAGQLGHTVSPAYAAQYAAEIQAQQRLAMQMPSLESMQNPAAFAGHGYPGSQPASASLAELQASAFAQAGGLRGMVSAASDPLLVNKPPAWGMGMAGQHPYHMLRSGPHGLMAHQKSQAISIEENVEKQIDKLSSRRPKRARRANYNLKSIVPGMDSAVGSLVKPFDKSPKGHKPSSPRNRPKPAQQKDQDDQKLKQKPEEGESASTKSASDTVKSDCEDENKPKKKRKRNPETTSHYRGVSWNKANKSWKACIKVKGKNIHIGYFGDDVDAAKAYDMIAQQYRGSSAKVNFPESRDEFSRAVHSNLE